MSKLSLRRCTGAWERCRELRESGADPGLPLLASLGWCFTRENMWTSCQKKSGRRSLLLTIYGTFAPWLTRYGPISLSTQRLIFHSRHFTTKSHLIHLQEFQKWNLQLLGIPRPSKEVLRRQWGCGCQLLGAYDMKPSTQWFNMGHPEVVNVAEEFVTLGIGDRTKENNSYKNIQTKHIIIDDDDDDDDDEWWWKMMKDDERWWKMMKDDERWWKMMKDDERWWKMMKDDERWWKMMKDDERWWKMMKDDER